MIQFPELTESKMIDIEVRIIQTEDKIAWTQDALVVNPNDREAIDAQVSLYEDLCGLYEQRIW